MQPLFIKMLRTTLIIYCLITQLVILAQIPPSDSRKISTILGADFEVLNPRESYPYSDLCSNCSFVPSINLYRDTTGVVYNHEYLLFRHPLAYTDGKELAKWMNLNHVTVEEYNEFQYYVRDSIARGQLHYGLESDQEALEFLVVDKDKVDIYGFKGPYYSDRMLDREKYPLNWNKKFSYAEAQYVPILANLYLPRPQRYYRQRKFDDRKFVYKFSDKYNMNQIPGLFTYQSYYWANNDVPTFSNTYLWSTISNYDRDIWNVHGQLYLQLFNEEKIIGISGVQANAFCNWKQQQLQKEFNNKGLNYNVIVSLPIKEDLENIATEMPKYNLKSKDFTVFWRITVDEYEHFIKSVQDSILTEELFNRIPVSDDKMLLLETNDLFFNETALEYSLFDPSKVMFNRSYFNLKQSKKMEKKYTSLVENIRDSSEYINPIFVYWINDAYSRSIVGNLVPERSWIEGKFLDSIYLEIDEKDSLGLPIGMDYSYPYTNNLGHSTGVRAHEDLSRFYKRKVVKIIPEVDKKQDKKSLIQGLTYEQAVAFYYWKYPIQFAKEGDAWQQYVIPSKEQFEQVQRGEKVILPEQTVEYPSPMFRYVVHVLLNYNDGSE